VLQNSPTIANEERFAELATLSFSMVGEAGIEPTTPGLEGLTGSSTFTFPDWPVMLSPSIHAGSRGAGNTLSNLQLPLTLPTKIPTDLAFRRKHIDSHSFRQKYVRKSTLCDPAFSPPVASVLRTGLCTGLA
jgi:hypothetical protein